MIYALYIFAVLVILTWAFFPRIKIKDKTIFTPLVIGGIGLLVLLILDLTLKDLYIDPIAFSFFGLEVHWYALWIMLGVVVAVIMGVREGKKLGIYSDFIYTGLIITLPLAIIGARLWYVLFNLDQFHSVGDVLGLNGGWAGLAIQGGVIVAIITVYIYCRKTKVSLYRAFDILAPGFLIGQIFGRWGNFCNHELYGPMIHNEELFQVFLPRFISDNMYIKGGDLLSGLKEGYYQPMFLYESVLNLVGLIGILIARRKFKKLESGDMLGLYLIWYGIVRTITESFRFEGEVLMVGPIRVSILFSVIFIICGILFLVFKRKFGPRNNYQEVLSEVANNKIDTVIFDLDGTLLDTKRLIFQSFIHVFEKYFPEHELTDEELDSFFGPTLYQSFSRYSTDEKMIEEMIAYYREFNQAMHDEMVQAFPNVKDVLHYLAKHKYKLAVVSSKKNDLVNHGLEFTKIREYFTLVIGSDDVVLPKPNPEGLLLAKEKLEGKNCLYVGDSVSDIVAGKNANMKTCAVIYRTDDSRADALLEAKPDYIIDSMPQLLKRLGE